MAWLLGYEVPPGKGKGTGVASQVTSTGPADGSDKQEPDEGAARTAPTEQKVASDEQTAEGLALWRTVAPRLKPYDPERAMELPEWLQNARPCDDKELATNDELAPRPKPLLPPSRLAPVLRRLLRASSPTQEVDTTRLIDALARIRIPDRVPRRQRMNWTARLQVYWDQAPRLGAFWMDQYDTVRWLKRWRGEQGLELIIVDENGEAKWERPFGKGRHARVARLNPMLPDAGTAVLALTDLGAAAIDKDSEARWLGIAHEAGRRGAQVCALVPLPLESCSAELRTRAHATEWERVKALGSPPASQRLGGEERRQLVDKLFVYLSPALCVDWALLRAMRLLLLDQGADAGLEIEAFLDPRAVGQCEDGFGLDYDAAKELRHRFARLPDVERDRVAEVFGAIHGHLGLAMRCEEQLVWGDPTERLEAERQLASYVEHLRQRGSPNETERGYSNRCASRQSPSGWKSLPLAGFWAIHHARGEGFDAPLPDGLDVQDVLWTLRELPEVGSCRVWQRGSLLRVALANSEGDFGPNEPGCRLAELPLRVQEVEVIQRSLVGASQSRRLTLRGGPQALTVPDASLTRIVLATDLAEVELVRQHKPPWATSFYRNEVGLWVGTEVKAFLHVGHNWVGEPENITSVALLPHELATLITYPPWATRLEKDEYGLYAILELAPGVETRMRWIPPGKFIMGSSSLEHGRLDLEGPQHRVVLTQGFWLADAPCTQAEWAALMGSNPSRFQERSEGVQGKPASNWGQHPVERVSWDDCQEYCQKLKERFPSLEARLPTEAEWEYACRAGTGSAYNDGSKCTRATGKDPALEKLGWYDANSGGMTHPVRGLAPNAWGIHDAHGNVWEWCEDWFGDYSAEEQQDPKGPVEGSDRVARGGCWFNLALNCRSAFRRRGPPVDRFEGLGFRLASGQVSQVLQEGKEQASQGGEVSGRQRRGAGGAAQAADGERSPGGQRKRRHRS